MKKGVHAERTVETETKKRTETERSRSTSKLPANNSSKCVDKGCRCVYHCSTKRDRVLLADYRYRLYIVYICMVLLDFIIANNCLVLINGSLTKYPYLTVVYRRIKLVKGSECCMDGRKSGREKAVGETKRRKKTVNPLRKLHYFIDLEPTDHSARSPQLQRGEASPSLTIIVQRRRLD